MAVVQSEGAVVVRSPTMSPSTPLAVLGVAVLLAVGGHADPRWSGDVDPQIVGGDETTIEKFPYQVALFYNNNFRCGGSILNEKFILTAAHCLQSIGRPTLLSIRAGSTERESGGQHVSVVKMTYDKRFSMNNMRYDVGLLKLDKALVFGEKVQPIKLVDVGEAPKTGRTVTVTGWGTVEEGYGSGSSKLRTVDVQVKNRFLCSIPYLIMARITDQMFCASAWGKDSCQGDSGGPAVNEQGQQVGVVSFGAGCARPVFNGVYTNLANKEIREFIDTTLQTL